MQLFITLQFIKTVYEQVKEANLFKPERKAMNETSIVVNDGLYWCLYKIIKIENIALQYVW